MRQIANYRIRREPESWRHAGGRYHPGRQLIIRDRRRSLILPIRAGTADDVTAYRQGTARDGDTAILVVTVNHAMGYAGLETFAGDGEPLGDIFLQSEGEIRELLGPRGTDLSPATIARRLESYL